MKIRFFGGPFHHRALAIPDELALMHRLEFRVTSVGENHSPVPLEWQRVAIYGRREDRPPTMRYFLGLADES